MIPGILLLLLIFVITASVVLVYAIDVIEENL